MVKVNPIWKEQKLKKKKKIKLERNVIQAQMEQGGLFGIICIQTMSFTSLLCINFITLWYVLFCIVCILTCI